MVEQTDPNVEQRLGQHSGGVQIGLAGSGVAARATASDHDSVGTEPKSICNDLAERQVVIAVVAGLESPALDKLALPIDISDGKQLVRCLRKNRLENFSRILSRFDPHAAFSSMGFIGSA
jgi:hypothetical protein